MLIWTTASGTPHRCRPTTFCDAQGQKQTSPSTSVFGPTKRTLPRIDQNSSATPPADCEPFAARVIDKTVKPTLYSKILILIISTLLQGSQGRSRGYRYTQILSVCMYPLWPAPPLANNPTCLAPLSVDQGKSDGHYDNADKCPDRCRLCNSREIYRLLREWWPAARRHFRW